MLVFVLSAAAMLPTFASADTLTTTDLQKFCILGQDVNGCNYIMFNDQGQQCFMPGDNTPGPSATNVADANTLYAQGCTHTLKGEVAKRQLSSCYDGSILLSGWECIWYDIVASVAALFISIAAWLLALAGFLFNWLMDNTVILFATSIYGKAGPAVESAWAAFRDIANILIIGIFTFIAISIILGLEEFGQKKLIARVLIVAVLINFSLLFSKMAIDASNYLSLQIYSASTGRSANDALNDVNGNNTVGQSGVNPFNGYADSGIAGAFVGIMGVTGITDATRALVILAEERNGVGVMFVHGLLTAVLFLGAALVLLYGSFLLISRAIILIFLLATSSVAFASYLIPKWGHSKLGWDTWTRSFIWAATLGPILLLLLWMTLDVAYAMRSKVGTLGDLTTNPTNGADMSALFVYLITLGLLFISFRVASMAANKVSGFDFAAMATVLPLTLGSRMAGFALRQTAGWAGYGYQKSQTAQAQSDRDRAMRARMQEQAALNRGDARYAKKFGDLAAGYEKRAAGRLKNAARGGAIASSKFNLMNTGAAQQAMKAAGVSGFATGASSKGAKSYADRVKADADAIEKQTRAAAAGVNEGDIRKQTESKVREERERARKEADARRDDAKNQVDAIRNAAEQEKEGLKDGIQKLSEDLKAAQSAPNAAEARRANELRDAADRNAGANEIMRIKARHESEMYQEKAKIEQVKKNIEEEQRRIQPDLAAIDAKYASSLKKATDALDDLDSQVKRFSKDSAESKELIKQAGDASINAARQTVQNIASGVRHGVLRNPMERELVAKEVRGRYKSSAEKSSVLKTIEEATKATEKPAAPAAEQGK